MLAKIFSLGKLLCTSACKCSGTCAVTVCVSKCGVSIVGATVTIKSGSTTVATGTTIAGGCTAPLNIGTAGTYTIVIAASGQTTTTLTNQTLVCGQIFPFDFSTTTLCVTSWCQAPYTCGATVSLKVSLAFTGATKSGGNTVYNGAGSPSYVGQTMIVTGFGNAGNNGTFMITASSAISTTVVNAGGVTETHAGTGVLQKVAFSGTTDSTGCIKAAIASGGYEVTIKSAFPTVVFSNAGLSCGGSSIFSVMPTTARVPTITDVNGTYTSCQGASWGGGEYCYYINNGKPICAGDTSYFVGYVVQCQIATGVPVAGTFVVTRFWITCSSGTKYAGVNNGGICQWPPTCNFTIYGTNNPVQGCLQGIGTPDPCDPTGAFSCDISLTTGSSYGCPNIGLGDPVGGPVSVSW